MEFYGSIDSVSGSITASLFTGSFKGDGGSLYNLPASGVTGLNLSQIASGNATASISSTGFTVNKSTQIQGDLSVTGSIIATNYIVSSSVTYMTTSFASGSSMFGNDSNDVHQFTGSVAITGSITLNGQAIGTGKLDETTFQSYTSSISSSIGSLSSSIALTDVSQSNRLTTIEGNYATTGSNLFKGSQTISGSIIPSVDNTYDLGSSTYQWRDVYISSGSLYIDGTKVLGSTSQELTITTDTGQSIKILEGGSDSIILQSADGDIELKSSGGGDILFDPTSGLISIKGTTQIQDGFKITSSGGTNIVFGDSIIVSGSIELTGNVDGIDLQSFSSSVSTSISSLLGGNTSLSSSIATTTSGLSSSINSLSSSVATTTSGLTSTITSVSSSLTSSIGSLSSSVATTTSGLSSSIGSLSSSVATTTNDLSSSIATTTLGTKNRVDSIETSTGSLNTFTSSINTTIKSKLDSESVISGSVQVNITGTTGYSTFSTSISTSIGELSSSVATTTSGLSSSIGSLSSSIATTTLNTKNRVDSIETSTGSLNTFTSSASGRLTSLETASGSIRTDFNTYTGSNNTTNTTQDGRLTSIEGITGSISSLNTYTGSNNTVIGTLQTSTSSLNSYTSSNTTNIDAIHTSTGSFKSFTSSFDTAFGMSGADVTVKGNLTVSGTQTTVNSTTVAIGDNIIQLNGTGATNAGLVVRDATAPNTVSGSFLWDSTNDKWIAGALGSEDDVVLKTATQTLTNKTINASQLVDASVTNAKLQYSSLSIAGTSVSLNGSISAATILSGTGTVSGSSQISHDSTTGYVANRHIDHTAVSISGGNGLSGGGDISTTRTISLDTTSATFTTGVKSKMNADGIVSGSSQITFGSISSIPSGLVSGSAQITLASTTGFGTYINQTLLTTSTPTFSTVSATTFTGALSGNASTVTNGVYTTGTQTIAGEKTFSDRVIYSKPFYRSFDTFVGSDDSRRTKTYSGVLVAASDIGGSSAYTIIDTNVPQESFQMGGFTIEIMMDYENTNNKTKVDLAGYWNPENNGGFTGWEAHFSNPGYTPTIQIARKTATGNVSFIITNSSASYQIFVARDLWLGYNESTAESTEKTWGDDWAIVQSANTSAYTNLDTVVNRSSSVSAGTGISVNKTTNDVTVTNTGTLAVAGTSNQVLVNGGTSSANGNITLSLPQNIGTGSSPTFAGLTNNGTYTQSTTSTQPVYITGDSGDTSGIFRIQIDSVSDSFGTGARTFLGDGGIDIFLGTGNSSYTPANTYIALNHSGEISMGAGSATKHFTLSTGGNLTISGTIGASNLSGTNTGDQTNISGNAATASSVNFANIATGTRTNYNLDFKPLTDSYAGIRFSKSTSADGAADAGYILIRGTSDGGDIYTAEGITMVADAGWLTLSQRTTAGKGVRITTGTSSSVTRFSVAAAGDITVTANMAPSANNTYNLGSASFGWANVYTNDLHLSNMNKPEGNDIDGTSGNWTIQEGAEQLYIINNNNGKKFKIDLTEII